jgi:monoamine oxidase
MAKPNLQDVSGRQKRVAIPGAGLSGLTIANELERAGYDVTANG